LDFARGGKTFASVLTNEMGAFKIPEIEQGTYDLRVGLPEGSIAISDLQVIAS
jgi:hypothetical protein